MADRARRAGTRSGPGGLGLPVPGQQHSQYPTLLPATQVYTEQLERRFKKARADAADAAAAGGGKKNAAKASGGGGDKNDKDEAGSEPDATSDELGMAAVSWQGLGCSVVFLDNQ